MRVSLYLCPHCLFVCAMCVPAMCACPALNTSRPSYLQPWDQIHGRITFTASRSEESRDWDDTGVIAGFVVHESIIQYSSHRGTG